MMTAWLYRRSDLEIVGLVDLPGDLPDVMYVGDVMYLRRGDDVSLGRVVYVEATIGRVTFASLRKPPRPSDAGVELIDDPTQPLAGSGRGGLG